MFWFLIGANVGLAIGWVLAKKFNNDLEALIKWLNNEDNDHFPKSN